MRAMGAGLLLLALGAALAAPVLAAPDAAALQAQAQAGSAEAQFQLGEAYRSGRGVAADPESAIMWYRRAATQGHVRAGEELGFALFAHGDRREAMPYIEAAAARGEARAFYLLGTAHFNGDYATRDWPLAYAQTTRAAVGGLPAAQRNLETMDRYLLPADKDKAQQILATLPPLRQPPVPTTVMISADGTPRAVAGSPSTAPRKDVAAAAMPATGPWKVQLGAYSSADRARDRWRTLAERVPALAGHGPSIVAAGSVQRLQARALASRAAAQSLCQAVRAAGGDCLVLAP